MNKCNKCTFEWISRKPIPRCCPKCKTYNWQKIEPKEEEYIPDDTTQLN